MYDVCVTWVGVLLSVGEMPGSFTVPGEWSLGLGLQQHRNVCTMFSVCVAWECKKPERGALFVSQNTFR